MRPFVLRKAVLDFEVGAELIDVKVTIFVDMLNFFDTFFSLLSLLLLIVGKV